MTFTIAAALYYDHDLASDPAPLAALITSLTSTGDEYRQFRVLSAPRKSPPPTKFSLRRLLARVTSGETATAMVETPIGTPDADALLIAAGTRPISRHPERFTLTKCRYHAEIVLGANRVAGLDAVITFADDIAARAGAIFVSDNAAYATALATCGGGSGLTAAQIDRITDGLYWRPHWGDLIRGPAWGTFLGAHHVETLGGFARIEREANCARVAALRSGGAYLQTTIEPTDTPVPDSLTQLLEPLTRKSTVFRQ